MSRKVLLGQQRCPLIGATYYHNKQFGLNDGNMVTNPSGVGSNSPLAGNVHRLLALGFGREEGGGVSTDGKSMGCAASSAMGEPESMGPPFVIQDPSSGRYAVHMAHFPFRLQSTADISRAAQFVLKKFDDGLALCNATTGTYVIYIWGSNDAYCPDPYAGHSPRAPCSLGGQRGMKVRLIRTDTIGLVKIQMQSDGLSGYFGFRSSRRAEPGSTDSLRLNVNNRAGSTLALLQPDGAPYDHWEEKEKAEQAKADALNGTWTMTGELAQDGWGTTMIVSGRECWEIGRAHV